jgi:hypothetical protein
MRRNKRMTFLAIGIGALLLAGGAAFTNSVVFTNTNTTLAYGQEVVSGATVAVLTYGLSPDGSTVNSVTVATVGDTSGSTASVGFTDGGGNEPVTTCTLVDYNITNPGDTTYTCPGLSEPVAGILDTDIVVS